MTNDGRYLTVDEIDSDHLRNIRRMLLTDMTPGYDQAAGRKMAQDFMASRDGLLDWSIEETWVDLDRDAYIAVWLRIIDDESSRRRLPCPS